MKNRKFSDISHRILVILLCVCMAATTFMLVSCGTDHTEDVNNGNTDRTENVNNGNNSDNTDKQNNPEAEPVAETVEVVRFAKNVKIGEIIDEDAIEVVSLRKTDIPINAISDKNIVLGKYAVSDMFKGDFIFPAKLSADPVSTGDIDFPNGTDRIDYTLVTKYAALVNNGDYTEAIKRAIADNPNATIYFPDGEYCISDTIVILAQASKGVSFKLSNYATIKAINWTDKTVPMIRIGVEPEGYEKEDAYDVRNTYIIGGVIDAAGIASGISLEGGKDITLSNITVKNAYYGLDIKCAPNQAGATCADIENVNVTGTCEKGSVGVMVSGSYNTFTNMKISDVQYGVKCTETGSNNFFRSIMAIGTGLEGTDNAGFWELSDGNQYDICYSDQFAKGFIIDERSNSLYNGCNVSWWSADNDYHVGFYADGMFNSVILYSKVYHNHTVTTDAYLIVETAGGSGDVQYPIKQIVSTQYDSVLKEYCKTDILN